jgi:ElaB/YqjD/DUF883 family membrane-anchored ribosome-binding protein
MEIELETTEDSPSALARERVLADLKSLVRDSEDLLKATASDVSEKAREVRTRLTAALERARSTCNEMQEETLAKAKEVAKRADTMVRAHPYESIGVAFGVGLLIGVLVNRK